MGDGQIVGLVVYLSHYSKLMRKMQWLQGGIELGNDWTTIAPFQTSGSCGCATCCRSVDSWDAGGNASGGALGGLISYGQSLTAGRPTTVGKHRPTVLSWLTRPDGPTLAGSRFWYYMHHGLDHPTGSNLLYALFSRLSNIGVTTSKAAVLRLMWLRITKIWNTFRLQRFLLVVKLVGRNTFLSSIWSFGSDPAN